MVDKNGSNLLGSLTSWINSEKQVRSAVLFGSCARKPADPARADRWSDIDLHLIVDRPADIVAVDWGRALPQFSLCLGVTRQASGGVSKHTLLFHEGEVDLVLVPTRKMQSARRAFNLGPHRQRPNLERALNTFATIMTGGFHFIKGQREWSDFYTRVVNEVAGDRIGNGAARQMADEFLLDFFSLLRKVRRGELIAAQRVLHRSLNETNISLLHELRIRSGRQTFQQARRVEALAPPREVAAITTTASLSSSELIQAAWASMRGLQYLMTKLQCGWSAPKLFMKLAESVTKPQSPV